MKKKVIKDKNWWVNNFNKLTGKPIVKSKLGRISIKRNK